MTAVQTAHRHAVFHPLRVEHVEPLTDDAVAVTFAVPEELRGDYAFVQGQHVTLRTQLAGDDVRRNYSICAPVSSGRLRIAVKRLAGGAFSAYALGRMRVGDVVEVMTPTGSFFTSLDPANAKHYCALVAGSGITPLMSIIPTTLETEPASRFTLFYANRTSKSVMFLEELEDLKDRYPDRFHLAHLLTREPQEVELFSGRLDGERLRRLAATILPVETVDEWFICGPYEMVLELRRTLLDLGVGRRQVHAELFHVGATPPAVRAEAPDATQAGAAEVTITLDGRQSRFPLARDGVSVLEGALQVRSDAPFACRGGVCGTCRARVVEGEVRMDQNWALEQEEIDAGYVLTCQSHPTTDRLVVDYDA